MCLMTAVIAVGKKLSESQESRSVAVTKQL